MEVCYHTLIKLKIIEKFLPACNTLMRKKDASKGKFGDLTYIETHAGDGEAYVKEIKKTFDGSATIVAKLKPEIKCIFIEYEKESAEKLNKKIGSLVNSTIIRGDCNKEIKNVLDGLDKDSVTVVFADPFRYKDLNWETVKSISNRPKTDIILNFPIGIVTREVVNPDNWNGLHKFFGTEEWTKHKDNIADLVKFYLKRLNYSHYSIYLVRTVPTNTPLYLIILCTNNMTCHRIGNWVWNRTVDKWAKETFPLIVHQMRSLKEFTKIE